MLIICELDEQNTKYYCPWHDVIMPSAIHMLHFVGIDTNNGISTPDTNIWGGFRAVQPPDIY